MIFAKFAWQKVNGKNACQKAYGSGSRTSNS